MEHMETDVFTFDEEETSLSDAALEAWLAEAGLDAEVVGRCPQPHCEVCDRLQMRRAA